MPGIAGVPGVRRAPGKVVRQCYSSHSRTRGDRRTVPSIIMSRRHRTAIRLRPAARAGAGIPAQGPASFRLTEATWCIDGSGSRHPRHRHRGLARGAALVLVPGVAASAPSPRRCGTWPAARCRRSRRSPPARQPRLPLRRGADQAQLPRRADDQPRALRLRGARVHHVRHHEHLPAERVLGLERRVERVGGAEQRAVHDAAAGAVPGESGEVQRDRGGGVAQRHHRRRPGPGVVGDLPRGPLPGIRLRRGIGADGQHGRGQDLGSAALRRAGRHAATGSPTTSSPRRHRWPGRTPRTCSAA